MPRTNLLVSFHQPVQPPSRPQWKKAIPITGCHMQNPESPPKVPPGPPHSEKQVEVLSIPPLHSFSALTILSLLSHPRLFFPDFSFRFPCFCAPQLLCLGAPLTTLSSSNFYLSLQTRFNHNALAMAPPPPQPAPTPSEINSTVAFPAI